MKPEDVGSSATQVMDLIVQLEGKVRQKSEEIERLKEESDDWRRKFLLLWMLGWKNPIPLMVGVVVGTGIGALVEWIILGR